jgi:Tol biopolymer transport system component
MDIYRIELSASGGEAHGQVPLIASSRLERYPSYAPDGKKIAFASLRSGKWQLWITDSDGGNAVQLTSFTNGEVAFPVWSHDSGQIGFTFSAGGLEQGYIVEANGGKPRKLEMLGTNVFNWAWSRDGHWIYFMSTGGGRRQLWKLPATGGVAELVAPQEASGGFAESVDGKLIYYIRLGGIWCVPVGGGPEREVVKSEVDPGVLEVTRFGMYFVAHSSVTRNGDLMFYRLPKGPVTRVADIKTRYGHAVSPDGRWLIYTTLRSTGSDLMLVENFH